MTKSSKKNIVVRLEASKKMGLGHILRCLNLISIFPNQFHFIFLIKADGDQSDIQKLLKEKGHQLILLDENLNWTEDQQKTIETIKNTDAIAFINDLIYFDLLDQPEFIHDYVKLVSDAVPTCFTITLGDPRVYKYYADLVINPNPTLGKTESDFKNEKGKTLFGSQYFLAHPRFQEFDFKSKEIKEKAENILVSIGGSDPFKVTNKIADLLKSMDSVNIRILIGMSRSPEEREFFQKIQKVNPNIQCLEFTNNMAGEFYKADIAIVGEGNIKFESALSGTPTILITQFDHDSDPVNYYKSQGTSIYAGRGDQFDQKAFLDTLTELINNKEKRQELSQKGFENYNPEGAKMIFETYIKPSI